MEEENNHIQRTMNPVSKSIQLNIKGHQCSEGQQPEFQSVCTGSQSCRSMVVLSAKKSWHLVALDSSAQDFQAKAVYEVVFFSVFVLIT